VNLPSVGRDSLADTAFALPDNGGYMVAAYVAAAVILLTYAWFLYRRTRKL
jgi:hypothetical protein